MIRCSALTWPELASYFTSENAAIAAGTVVGQKISLVAIGIDNGWFASIIQEKASIYFSFNNTYKLIISAFQHKMYLESYETYCLPLLKKCGAVAGSDADCEMGYHICYNTIEFSMSSVVDMDPYDVRKEFKNPSPPKTYVAYLRRQEVVKAIGANAKIPYAECSDKIFSGFTRTGDSTNSLWDCLI